MQAGLFVGSEWDGILVERWEIGDGLPGCWDIGVREKEDMERRGVIYYRQIGRQTDKSGKELMR